MIESKKFKLQPGLRGNTTLVIERLDGDEVTSAITVSLTQVDMRAIRETLCGKKDEKIEQLEGKVLTLQNGLRILGEMYAENMKRFDQDLAAHKESNTKDLGVLAQSIKELDKVIPELGNSIAATNAKVIGLRANVDRVVEWMNKMRE